ncbi:hypothetical protein GCM10009665_32920 [Kitasatospora nipponensis]|uniref:Uncharacterized protein n=1 Tax=Kitasatospora nipponensis TaxID=258049 RepID=A0ABP4GV65_9ACTN
MPSRRIPPPAGAALCCLLKKEGLTISAYQEKGADGTVDAEVRANHPSDYNLAANSAGDGDEMTLSATSPCLQPPGSPTAAP